MFLNICAVIATDDQPQKALTNFHSIESRLGRTRDTPKGDRTIDIDIFLAEKINSQKINASISINEENLLIPHPEGHKRNFVLIPANEVAPNWHHPTLNKTVSDLCHNIQSKN